MLIGYLDALLRDDCKHFDSLYYTLKRLIKCFVRLRNRIVELNNRREELWQKREKKK